jgi:hypothetical protein
MEHIYMAAPTSTPPRRTWLGHAAVAFATTVALYLAPFAYFLTACTSTPDFGERIQWVGLTALFLPVLFPGYVALAAIVVCGGLFGASYSERFVRIRTLAIPATIATVAAGALAIGAIAPTSCSLF